MIESRMAVDRHGSRIRADSRNGVRSLRLAAVASACVLVLSPRVAAAQELTPRAYWPAPTGTKVVALGYQHSTGDVLIDPSLLITGVDSRINVGQLTYQQYFSLLGRTTSLQFGLPYSWGTTEGIVAGEFRSRSLSALADARVRFSVNLRGAPAMDPAAFLALRAAPRTILGASLVVQAPTGEYEADRLLNVGTHRWAFKPALGVIWPLRPTWLVEAELGVWIFGDNDEFLGVTREQAPIVSSEFHLIKELRSGIWAAFDANLYTGGRTTVGGVLRADLQRNSRIGGTLMFPFKGGHAVRGTYSTGVAIRSGGDFEIVSLAYLYAWR